MWCVRSEGTVVWGGGVAYDNALAGSIWDSGAASMTDCHVLVDPGITNPKVKFHSSVRHN